MDQATAAGTRRSIDGPIEGTERYECLDVLRGFAVLGIFAINIWHFGLPESFYINPTALGPLEGADKLIWHGTALFVALKFHTLFALMFGAGIAMMAARAGASLHRRRMVILLGFGLIHAYLIWPGDVLVSYALCGLLATGMRHWSVPRLWIVGGILVTVGGIVSYGLGYSLSFAPQDAIDRTIAESWAPPEAALAAEITLRAEGSWFAQIRKNVETAFFYQTVLFVFGIVWRTLGVMAFGMALYKSGILTGRRSMIFYSVMALGGLGLGLPIVEAGIIHNEMRDWEFVAANSTGMLFNYVGSLLVAAGYIGALIAFARSGTLPALRRALAATGRMAFTNYIAQSLIATTLMYGFGFGLFGSLSVSMLFMIVVAVWAVQMVWSPFWLGRFDRGPLEALWRRLTYGRFQGWTDGTPTGSMP